MPRKDERGDVDKLAEGIQALAEGRVEDAAKAWREAQQIQEAAQDNVPQEEEGS